MDQPLVTTITIDGEKFDALSVSVGITTLSSHVGMPQMGSLQSSIEIVVNLNDDRNMPFGTLLRLFNLAKIVTRDKIKDIKIELWKDEKRQDVICSYAFEGWINHFQTQSGGGANHTLILSLQPALNPNHFLVLDMKN